MWLFNCILAQVNLTITVSTGVPFSSDRAGSISTLDSLDFARYSDDGNRESEERLAGKMNHIVRAESKRPSFSSGEKQDKVSERIGEWHSITADCCIKDVIIIVISV